MSEKKNKVIQPNVRHLILCEGIDEKLFFIWYLDYLKKHGYTKLEDVQLEDSGFV